MIKSLKQYLSLRGLLAKFKHKCSWTKLGLTGYFNGSNFMITGQKANFLISKCFTNSNKCINSRLLIK